MRQKSQSVSVPVGGRPNTQQINYDLCIYSCVILRKKLFGVASRFLYLFPDQIAITKVSKVIF